MEGFVEVEFVVIRGELDDGSKELKQRWKRESDGIGSKGKS